MKFEFPAYNNKNVMGFDNMIFYKLQIDKKVRLNIKYNYLKVRHTVYIK